MAAVPALPKPKPHLRGRFGRRTARESPKLIPHMRRIGCATQELWASFKAFGTKPGSAGSQPAEEGFAAAACGSSKRLHDQRDEPGRSSRRSPKASALAISTLFSKCLIFSMFSASFYNCSGWAFCVFSMFSASLIFSSHRTFCRIWFVPGMPRRLPPPAAWPSARRPLA